MKRLLHCTLAAAGLAISTMTWAGPVHDFEVSFREAYADYRSALFATNSGDAAATDRALTGFSNKWMALVSRWGATPPPQYADDPTWPEVLKSASAIISRASDAVRSGGLPAAHEILEHFRDEIGALHARNDIVTISDRMNAYHEKMEKVLGDGYEGWDAAGRARLAGDMAVLAYLAEDLDRHRPAALVGSTEFQGLMGAVRSSIAAVNQALAGGQPDAIRKAVGGLKPAYSKFFLRFG